MNMDISKNIAKIIADACETDLKSMNSSMAIKEFIKDSLSFVQVIVEIEEKFQIEFENEDFISDRFKTISDLENRVMELMKI